MTILFTIEMLTKWIAMGVIMHPDAYFRTGWNALDGFVVIVSILNLALSGLSFVRGFRALRALRPLRYGFLVSFLNCEIYSHFRLSQ